MELRPGTQRVRDVKFEGGEKTLVRSEKAVVEEDVGDIIDRPEA